MIALKLFVAAAVLALTSAGFDYPPKPNCPGKKIFKQCKDICPANCEEKGPRPCITVCIPGCSCRPGYIERSKTDDTCILPEECPSIDLCALIFCGRPFICVDGECVCPKDTHRYNDDCVSCPEPKVFRRCPTNCPDNCEDTGPRPCTKDCRRDNYCVCPPGLIERSRNDHTCIHPSKCPSNPCAAVSCKKPSVCVDGECVCPKGTHLHEGNCVTCPKPKIFQPCASNCPDNCEEQGRSCTEECRFDNFCVCPPGYIERSNKDRRCVLPSKCPADECGGCPPGSVCINRECRCRIRCPPNSECVRGRCQCIRGYKRDEDGNCVKVICPRPKVFTTCAFICPATCEEPNPFGICMGVCKENEYCVCPEGWLERSRDDSTCVRPSQCKGKPCYGKRCPAHSECIDGICVPIKKCPSPKIFEKCPTSCPPTCDKPNPRICIAGCRPDVNCVCPPGLLEFSSSDTRCVTKRECRFSSPCSLIDCIQNSICIEDPPGNAKCVCIDGYFMDRGVCRDRCALVRCGANTMCEKGVCNCKDGFHRPPGGGPSCVPDKCPEPKISRDCPTMCPPTCQQPEPELCTDGCRDVNCVCPPGYVEISSSNSRCILLEDCRVSCAAVLCPENSKCKKGKCFCLDGYHMVDGQCVVSSPCSVILCIRNSICIEDPPGNGKCVCIDGYFMDGGVCRASCAAVLCPENSRCKKGKCFCLDRYHMVDGQCVEKCYCPGSNSMCRNGRCVCESGYRMVNGICRARGSCYFVRCRRPHEVCVENLNTHTGTCECKSGYERYGKRCVWSGYN